MKYNGQCQQILYIECRTEKRKPGGENVFAAPHTHLGYELDSPLDSGLLKTEGVRGKNYPEVLHLGPPWNQGPRFPPPFPGRCISSTFVRRLVLGMRVLPTGGDLGNFPL